MKWRGRRGSGNVEDRRGMRAGGVVGGGLGTIVLVILAIVFDVNPLALIDAGSGGPPAVGPTGSPDDDLGRFVDVVLGDTEDTWNRIFAAGGTDYPEPTVVLFEQAVRSACGTASSAVGPFQAPGDFARGYVIAHEVGHHVQNVTGTMREFRGYAESGPESEAVRIELQADCYAGIWAHDARARGYTEPGDLREALDAAAAIGDDNIQRRTSGTIVPESFTHGTSEQRVLWFERGYESGDPAACDTFGGSI
jgi:hypothetical protein